MKSNDMITEARETLRAQMAQAIKANDPEQAANAFDAMLNNMLEQVRAEKTDAEAEQDARVLASRGVRQLTNAERDYYESVAKAMRSNDPRQALANLDKTLPTSVIEAVIDQIATEHPLLNKIRFESTAANIRLLLAKGEIKGAWGKLCAQIVTEISEGFRAVDTGLLKVSAFLPVCKAALELGPAWLDNFVRKVLAEALANALEDGIINGSGKDEPIGMIRDCREDVTVTAGVYPEKEAIIVNKLDKVNLGALLGMLAKDENGKARKLGDLILVVNSVDYYEKVMPATTVRGADGLYKTNILPAAIEVIPSAYMEQGKAVLGIAGQYFAAAGIGKDGRIEYSDEAHFLEDERVYLIKAFANGLPLDGNAFLVLDINGLLPLYDVVETLEYDPETSADMLALYVGGDFVEASDFTSYVHTNSTAFTVDEVLMKVVPKYASQTTEVYYGDYDSSDPDDIPADADKYASGDTVELTTGTKAIFVKCIPQSGSAVIYTYVCSYSAGS